MINRAWIITGLIALGLVCYYLPWYTHATAGWTMHAFDLAEWTSINPAVRAEGMQTSLMLRLPHLLLVAALALVANRFTDPRVRWLLRGIALVMVLRFVPPNDYFGSLSNDPNFQQMAELTIIGAALTLAMLPMAWASEVWQDLVLAVLVIAGLLAGWSGLGSAQTLLDNFQIDVAYGAGIFGLTIVTVMLAGLALGPHLRIPVGAGFKTHPS